MGHYRMDEISLDMTLSQISRALRPRTPPKTTTYVPKRTKADGSGMPARLVTDVETKLIPPIAFNVKLV
jgi:hypothetical protein